MSYPTSCLSEFCGRVLCDGCNCKPRLVEHYKSLGPAALERYEQRQTELREQKAKQIGIFAPPYQHTS